jgi:hypothetical protein
MPIAGISNQKSVISSLTTAVLIALC